MHPIYIATAALGFQAMGAAARTDCCAVYSLVNNRCLEKIGDMSLKSNKFYCLRDGEQPGPIDQNCGIWSFRENKCFEWKDGKEDGYNPVTPDVPGVPTSVRAQDLRPSSPIKVVSTGEAPTTFATVTVTEAAPMVTLSERAPIEHEGDDEQAVGSLPELAFVMVNGTVDAVSDVLNQVDDEDVEQAGDFVWDVASAMMNGTLDLAGDVVHELDEVFDDEDHKSENGTITKRGRGNDKNIDLIGAQSFKNGGQWCKAFCKTNPDNWRCKIEYPPQCNGKSEAGNV